MENGTLKSLSYLLVVCAGMVPVWPLFAQEHKERTLDEIKVEAVHRAAVGGYPLIGLDPADVSEAFKSIQTSDKDEWAKGFIGVADRYMTEGNALAKSDPKKADADYICAWRLYSFGRWPVESSPMKKLLTRRRLMRF